MIPSKFKSEHLKVVALTQETDLPGKNASKRLSQTELSKSQCAINADTWYGISHHNVLPGIFCVKNAQNEGTTHLTLFTFAEIVVVADYHVTTLETVLLGI